MATLFTLVAVCQSDQAADSIVTRHYSALGNVCISEQIAGLHLFDVVAVCVSEQIASSDVTQRSPAIVECVASAIVTRGYSALGNICVSENTADSDVTLADPSVEQFELYISTDGDDWDFDSPDETFTSLPHTTSLTLAEGEHRIIVRKRSKYDRSSFNLDWTTVTVDSSGDQQEPDPSAPFETSITQVAGNKARVSATYFHAQDAVPATQWLVYVTTDGSDPDPDVDSPTVVAMAGTGKGPRVLVHDTDALGDAVEVKAIVRTRRVEEFRAIVDSPSSAIRNVTISTSGPDEPTGTSIGYEQGGT